MMKLLDRIPDATLNKIGRRYNLFCVAFLVPYVLGIMVAIVARGFGWTAWPGWSFAFQVGWVLLWIPNLFLIGLRAHRDYTAIISGGEDFRRKVAEAEAEFWAFHARRMAWAKGEPEPDPETPPTVN